MSLETIFSQTDKTGIFYMNFHTYLNSLVHSKSEENSEEKDIKSKLNTGGQERLSILSNNPNNGGGGENIEIEYLKKIGILMKGPDFCSSEKKFVFSINIENDAPLYIDNLKKTLESLKYSINHICNEYKLNSTDILVIINFLKLKLNNFLYLFTDKNSYLITNEASDKPFFYAKINYDLDKGKENTEGFNSYFGVDLIAIYQPGSTKYLIQKYLFLGILPHLKLSSSSLSDPIFMVNIESGVITEEKTLTLLFNSLIVDNNTSRTNFSLPALEDNNMYNDIQSITAFDINKTLLSIGFSQDEPSLRNRESSMISNVTIYEQTLTSIYDLNFRNLLNNFDISPYLFMFKYSLKNYKLMIDYFTSKHQGESIIDYEDNYLFHLSRFSFYLSNEMKANIEFVPDAKVNLYLPTSSYCSWVEYNTNLQATKWAKTFYFLNYIIDCFSGKGCFCNYLYFTYDILSVFIDYFFLGIFTIISFIILNYCFESRYGAYTMLLYYPVAIVLTIVLFFLGPIKQLKYQIMFVNLTFHIYYLFLFITAIIGIAHIYSTYQENLNKAAFCVLFILNGIYYLVPFLIYFSNTLSLRGIVSGFQTLILFPNYTTIFLFGSFRNLFSKEYLSLHSLNILVYFALNFCLAFVLYRLDPSTGQRGILGLIIIFTILHSIKFFLILGNILYNVISKSKSISSVYNKNLIIQFWQIINTRRQRIKEIEKQQNENVNNINENANDSKSSIAEAHKSTLGGGVIEKEDNNNKLTSSKKGVKEMKSQQNQFKASSSNQVNEINYENKEEIDNDNDDNCKAKEPKFNYTYKTNTPPQKNSPLDYNKIPHKNLIDQQQKAVSGLFHNRGTTHGSEKGLKTFVDNNEEHRLDDNNLIGINEESTKNYNIEVKSKEKSSSFKDPAKEKFSGRSDTPSQVENNKKFQIESHDQTKKMDFGESIPIKDEVILEDADNYDMDENRVNNQHQ